MKLMVPGPAETYADDLIEMARPILPHYGAEFLKVWHSVEDNLKRIIGTRSCLIMVPGAGTAGTEMSLCGLAGRKCIVVRAGTFCDRIAEILTTHNASVVDVVVPDREAVTPDAVREALRKHPDAAAVCMVHSETSTGVIHPVAEIASVVRESKALFVVDAVSSMGAVDFRMDEWGVDVCWTASQKALGCPPGLAMVAVSTSALSFFEENRSNIRSWYLNPLVWKWHADNWEWHPYPTSLPTPVFVSMRKVLDRLIARGLPNQYRRQEQAACALRRGCRAIGFTLFAQDESIASPTITALLPPAGLDEAAFRDTVLREHGVMIAGGFGRLRGQIIRIGHMGPGIGEDYLLATLHAMENAARKQGIACAPGGSLAAAFDGNEAM